MIIKLLLIGVMGGVGSILRFVVSTAVARQLGRAFPFGTMTVNVVGCLLAGVAGALILPRVGLRDEWRLAILVGFLGGFTTFSAFELETLELLLNGDSTRAILNIAISVSLGLLAVWIGFRLTQALA